MDFRILGPLQVSDDGHDVAIRGEKLRALLGLLLVNANRAVSEGVLIEALWGDTASPRAADNLHVLVSRLRRPLGIDRIVRDGHGYRLCVADRELDLDRFLQLRSDGKLREALMLWRGAPLADFAYASWASIEIRRLEELRLVALEERIELDLAEGRHAELIGELHTIIEEEPLRENLRRQLIIALYRSGRQAEALEAYRAARKMLDEELGLEPGPELQELELAVLRHDPALDSPRRLLGIESLPKLSLRGSSRRTQVGVVLAAAFLAFVGSAAMILLIAPDEPQSVAAARPTSTAQSRVSRGRLTAQPREKPKTAPRARTRPAASKQPPKPVTAPRNTSPPTTAPTVRRRTSRPPSVRATQPAKRPTSVHVSRQRAKSKATSPRPAEVPKMYWLKDDFEGPAFNFGLWHIASHGSGVDVDERNGELEFSVLPEVMMDGAYGVDQHYGTGCRLTANFDARVEFELLAWPEANGMYATFGVYFPPPKEAFWSISRQAQPANGGSEAYSANVASTGRVSATSDVKGTLRLRREHGVLTMYFRSAGHWVELAGGFAPGPAILILSFNTNGDQFGHQAARAAFDNFEATAAAVDCAGYDLPPYKPRQ